MAFKLVTAICVLLVIIEYSTPVDASQYPHINPSIHLRQKRSSADFLGKIKSSITSSIGKASASSAGASSGTSSSKTFGHGYEKPVVEKEVHFDGWELKKSILNTLFQAVKAITGGITAIKGQLIKGSGYALTHGGKLVTASGDAVTNVGKKIALSAKLLPPGKPTHHKFFASSGHGTPVHAHEDYTSYGHDELVEFAQPHDLTGFGAEPPIPPYLPVDIGYDNHYPVPHAQNYGPPPSLLLDSPHSSHIPNFISTERKEQEQHYEKHDATRLTGLETDHDQSTIDVNQKAVEALQLLLRKLPNKLALKDNSIPLQPIDDDNIIPDTKIPTHITQYNIPKDPNAYIPKFKPIKSSVTSTYTFQVGPIEHITEDTYGGGGGGHGGVVVGNHHHHNHIHDSRKTDLLIQNTISAPALHQHLVPPSKHPITTIYKSHLSSPHLGHSHTINAQPLDLYHTMTLKNQPNHPQISPYLPQNSPQHPHSPHYEIQKSVEYNLH